MHRCSQSSHGEMGKKEVIALVFPKDISVDVSVRPS
jgi:hypothetical protein